MALNYTVVLWDSAGKPYWSGDAGERSYIPPAIAVQDTKNPRLVAWGQAQGRRPGQSLLKNAGTWNPNTGKWDRGINWTNLASIAAGSGIAAGAATVGAATASAPAAAAGAGGVPSMPWTLAGIPGAGTGITAPVVAAASNGFLGLGARDWLNAAIFGSDALGNIWGASKMAGASDRAAELQAQSQREALALLTKQWEKYQADFEPYLQAGRGAIGRMTAALEGTTPPAVPQGVTDFLHSRPAQYAPAGTVADWMRPGFSGTPRSSGQTPAAAVISPRPDTPPPAVRRPASQVAAPPLLDLSQPRPDRYTTIPVREGTGPMVWLEAPDGERQQVPAELAVGYIKLGARMAA